MHDVVAAAIGNDATAVWSGFIEFLMSTQPRVGVWAQPRYRRLFRYDVADSQFHWQIYTAHRVYRISKCTKQSLSSSSSLTVLLLGLLHGATLEANQLIGDLIREKRRQVGVDKNKPLHP